MSERITTYTEDGLTYQIRVFEGEDGVVRAEITVIEGQMDVNAVYYSSADYDGPSTNLGGPLNMNGAGSRFEGERISWEHGEPVSRPGLGREGTDKPSFLQAGDSITVDLPGAGSVDDVDLIGIRATSTSTPEGSIKGVSRTEPHDGDDDDDDDDDNGDDDNGDDDPATYGKVFFGMLDSDGNPVSGLFVLGPDEDPIDGVGQLPPDADGTFAEYVAFWEAAGFPDIDSIEAVIFYADGEGQEELFRINAPDGGFEDADSLLEAYEAAIADMEADGMDTTDMTVSLSIPVLPLGEGWSEDTAEAEPIEDEPVEA